MNNKLLLIMFYLVLITIFSGVSVILAQEFMFNDDYKEAYYTNIYVASQGYWYYPPGELRDAKGLVKGTVRNQLPYKTGLYVYYIFEYDSKVVEGYLFNINKNSPGEYLRKTYSVPYGVGYLITSGWSSIAHVEGDEIIIHWDVKTPDATASIPFT